MEFSIAQIAELINGRIEGNKNEKVNKIEGIQEAEKGSISFLSNPKYENYIYSTKASAVLVSEDFEPKRKINTTLIKVKDPYTSFTLLLEEYAKFSSYQKTGIEDPCHIGENSSTGDKIYRGKFSYIGDNVSIGDNVKIYPHVYIGDQVIIGDHCILYSGAKVYNNCRIGSNCVIHSGAVIGSHGFGFAPQPDGSYKSIPQVGNVIIDNNVDIGANTVIDRATFESTVIGKGVKLDNLIQVAHNVKIGENTVIAAQTGISGSAIIGKNCRIAGQVGISGHLKIADKVTLGAKTGVLADINENEVKLGSPSMDRISFLKSYSIFRILPELNKKIKELEKKIVNLTGNSNKENE